MRVSVVFAALMSAVSVFAFAAGSDESGGDGLHLSIAAVRAVEPAIARGIEVYRNTVDEDAHLSLDVTDSAARGVADGTYDVAASFGGLQVGAPAAGVSRTVIAVEGVVVILNSTVHIRDLTVAQIARVFLGDIANWSLLGGADHPIVLVSAADNSRTHAAFRDLVLEPHSERPVVDADLVVESDADMAQKVRQTPHSIGYIRRGAAGVVLDSGTAVPSIGGVRNTRENLLDGSYSPARPLIVLTRGEPDGDAGRFIDFLLSGTGQQILAEAGYMPVR